MPKTVAFPLAARLMPVQNFRDAGDAKQVAAPGTAEGKAARFEIVFTTGARVLRFDWLAGRQYLEELVVTKDAVDLSRLERGAPLLNSHAGWSLSDQLGVCENPRIENGRGLVDATLSRRSDVAGIVQDLKDAIIRNVSVGYVRNKVEKIAPAKEGDLWVYRVTRWQPMEISLCPMPADMDAQVKGEKRQQERTFPCEVSEITTRGAPAQHTVGGSPVDPEEQKRIEEAARQAERTRIADIQRRCQVARLGDDFARTLIEEGVSGDALSARILDAWASRQENEGTSRSESSAFDHGASLLADRIDGTSGEARRGSSRERDLAEAAEGGLLLRAGVPVKNPHPGAKDFRNASVADVARACLSIRGERSSGWFGRERSADVIKRAMSSSDFPNLLGNVLGKSLRSGYAEEPSSHKAWVKPSFLPDFKLQQRVILGSAPALQKVNEGGEYKSGSMQEDMASLQLVKYGNIVPITWEALVNDDLDAFTRIPQGMGQAAARLEADNVYLQITTGSGAGQVMQDSVALFDAAHANLHGSAVDFNSSALSLGRTLMRKQTAVGGGLMNIVPRFLIVSAERETAAEDLLHKSAIVKTSTSENPTGEWISRLTLIVEPRLPSTSLWLAASPTQVDTMEVAYLEEDGGPVSFRREGFEVDSIEFKIRHVHVARFLDWRGMVRVPLNP